MAKVQKSNKEARKPKAALAKVKTKAEGPIAAAVTAGKAGWGKATKK